MTDICVLSTVGAPSTTNTGSASWPDGVATLWPEIQRATLDIVARAFGRVVQCKEVLDTISGW
jgi:hypothetical protein